MMCVVGMRVLMGSAAGLLVALGRTPTEVYTVAQVQAGVRQHLRAWSGRTVLVRGWASGWVGTACTPPPRPVCRGARWIYLAPLYPSHGANDPAAPSLTLLLRHAAPLPHDPTGPAMPALLAAGLHTVPRLGPLLFPWGGSILIRVHLNPPHTCPTFGGEATCIDGTLLTAAQ